MRSHVLAGVLFLLLSGCAAPGSGDAEPLPGDQGPDADRAEPSGPAAHAGPEPSAPASNRTGRAAQGPQTTTREADWTAGLRAGAASNSFLGSGAPLEKVPGDGLTGVIVEMSWQASSPLSEEMSLDVSEGGRSLGAVSGPSPLRLVFPGGQAKGDLVLYGQPAAEPGAYVAQEFTFHLTVFRDIPFDPAYTALPA